ncbi:hypothetical protein Desaci_4166 [Desulfosporosinus acidiphilus SJ4]|uniref:Uncharacterized protein n=1 Tax=Desulfosporosinus acidiphilus (strain DSM 22704 / JCM 16185 / SJ4) TaxID=646529 RepID=I4DB54_DESAJ|nr:hypothetical protein [Desulfosporosinus acidiphilus]AFM43028.1 hypothetical protein Desaci_4166 [Desulfosporosinus acidiphilus SJ4]
MLFFKKIFDFFCGDWRIFWGITLTIIIVKLIESWEVPNPVSQAVFLLGISLSLAFSLKRETSV